MQTINERTHNINKYSPKEINRKFCKDGFVYLLKGSSSIHPDGYKSILFQRTGIRLQDETNIDIKQASFDQSIGIPSYFISLTTDYATAVKFANSSNGRINVLKLPYDDVCVADNSISNQLKESEYLVPDFICPDEIIKSFEEDDLVGLFKYLSNEIGLEINVKDIFPSGIVVTSDGKIITLEKIEGEIEEPNIKIGRSK